MIQPNLISSFPSKGTKSGVLLNKGPRTTFLALKDKVSFYSSVDQVIHILAGSPTRGIIKFERKESQLIEAFKAATELKDRVSSGKAEE